MPGLMYEYTGRGNTLRGEEWRSSNHRRESRSKGGCVGVYVGVSVGVYVCVGS